MTRPPETELPLLVDAPTEDVPRKSSRFRKRYLLVLLIPVGGPAAADAVGDAVPFVLRFNFLSGFVYVLAGIGIAMGHRWAVMLSAGLAVMIAVVFALFGLYVFQGGAFEMRTVGAMSLRLVVWLAIAVLAARHISL